MMLEEKQTKTPFGAAGTSGSQGKGRKLELSFFACVKGWGFGLVDYTCYLACDAIKRWDTWQFSIGHQTYVCNDPFALMFTINYMV